MKQRCTCGANHTSNPNYHLSYCDLNDSTTLMHFSDFGISCLNVLFKCSGVVTMFDNNKIIKISHISLTKINEFIPYSGWQTTNDLIHKSVLVDALITDYTFIRVMTETYMEKKK